MPKDEFYYLVEEIAHITRPGSRVPLCGHGVPGPESCCPFDGGVVTDASAATCQACVVEWEKLTKEVTNVGDQQG